MFGNDFNWNEALRDIGNRPIYSKQHIVTYEIDDKYKKKVEKLKQKIKKLKQQNKNLSLCKVEEIVIRKRVIQIDEVYYHDCSRCCKRAIRQTNEDDNDNYCSYCGVKIKWQ